MIGRLVSCVAVSIVAGCALVVDLGGLSDKGAGSDASSDVVNAADAADGAALFACKAAKAPPSSACTISAQCPDTTLVPASSAPPYYPCGLAADASHLYWTWSADYNCHTAGPVARVPKTGGSVETLLQSADIAGPIAVDDANVYFASGSAPPVIYRLSKPPCASGCGPDAIFTDDVSGAPPFTQIVTAGNGVVLATSPWRAVELVLQGATWTKAQDWALGGSGFSSSLAFDGRLAYTGVEQTAVVRRFDIVTQAIVPWATLDAVDASNPGATDIVTDCTSIFIQRPNSLIEQLGANAQLVRTFSPPSTPPPFDLGIDDTFLYVAAPDTGSVSRFPRSGGPPATIAQTTNVWRLLVEDDAIYYGEHAAGAIHRITK